LAGLALAAGMAAAEPVRNGNELALAYSSAKPAEQEQIRKEKTGVIHTFRYLRIVEIRKDEPAAGTVSLLTVEPSSDMQVRLVVRHKLSLASRTACSPTTVWRSMAACRIWAPGSRA